MASNGDDILNIMDWCRKISPFHRSLPEVSMIISIKKPTTSRHLACWIIFQYSMSPREKNTCGIISLHNFWNRFVTYYFSRNPPSKHLRWFRRCLSTCQVALVRGPPKRQDKNWKENSTWTIFFPEKDTNAIPTGHSYSLGKLWELYMVCLKEIGNVHLCLPMVGWGGRVFWPYDTGSFGSLMDEEKSQIESACFGIWFQHLGDLIPIHGEGSLMMDFFLGQVHHSPIRKTLN